MELIKQKHINAGVIKPGQKNVPIQWELSPGAFEQIEYVKATCGCTVPVFDANHINAKYNDSSDPAVIKINSNKAILVTKKLFVYLKDGKLLKVFNTRGIEEFNPDKEKIEISFTVTVSVE